MPTLIVGGTTDIIEPAAFTGSAELFSGPCEILIADGAGHWPHRESAELFHERLLAFLASLAVATTAQRGWTTSAWKARPTGPCSSCSTLSARPVPPGCRSVRASIPIQLPRGWRCRWM